MPITRMGMNTTKTLGGFMKNLVLTTIALALISVSSFAADVCTNHNGSVIYDTATTLDNSTVIMNPRVLIAGQEAFVFGTVYSDAPICKVLGFSGGKVSETDRSDNSLVARFNDYGQLTYVSTGSFDKIKTVVCLK